MTPRRESENVESGDEQVDVPLEGGLGLFEARSERRLERDREQSVQQAEQEQSSKAIDVGSARIGRHERPVLVESETHKQSTTPSLNVLSNAFLSLSSPCAPWLPIVPIPMPAHVLSVLDSALRRMSTSSHPIDAIVRTADGSGLAISLSTNDVACRIAWRPSEIGYEMARLCVGWLTLVVEVEVDDDEDEGGRECPYETGGGTEPDGAGADCWRRRRLDAGLTAEVRRDMDVVGEWFWSDD